MRVLGIHDGHNASACLIEDGQIRLAMQEERLTNKKNQAGFPIESIKFLLSYSKLRPGEIDFVALSSLHSSPLFASDAYFKKEKSNLQRQAEIIGMKTPLYSLYKLQRRQERLKKIYSLGFSPKKVSLVEHHACHAATAYFGSHFPRAEKVLVLTNDGAGDGLCATVSIGHNNQLTRLASVNRDNSLAGVYCLVTKMLGFKPLEHEYKLMGMAPYCSAEGEQKGYALFKELISISKTDSFLFERNISQPIAMLMSRLQKAAKFQRFDYVCAGLQKFTEEILVSWVQNCIKKTGIRKVALAGGIFMNVKANKRIMELPEVEDLFIFPSCGDETICFGAAYDVYNRNRAGLERPQIKPLQHFYLGDEFSDQQVKEQIEALQKSSSSSKLQFKFRWVKNIGKETALLLAKKKVVARCQGPMEFGARALGNRSILADPSDLGCIREINLMVKKRDFWMPFAPVILKERSDDYIINPKQILSPYMILSFDTTARYSELIAAVHQADLTARPQIITPEMNQGYYSVLKEFEKITGRGALLNTSFNLHGFPIVHGPKEALEVFRDSGLKYLALGNYLLEKES
ncbi:MAG TPA: carbamoyltransferase C-terminal domain-containing protein [Candidatus Nanoarchaeia archaeon]|nr:carbamoyltransferase C-terminal domain-containing protein [Candidatus Nanoarchaeia archaeon]